MLWSRPITVTYADLAIAAVTNTIALPVYPELAARGVLHDGFIEPVTEFRGGGLTTYTLSLGITGALSKYASALDVWQVPGGSVFQLSHGPHCESLSAVTGLKVTAVGSGNLSLATQGSARIYLMMSQIPL